MFPVFVIFLFAAATTALNVTVKDAIPSFPALSIQTTNQPLDSCGQAYIDDIVDSNSLAETIFWRIGTLAIKDKETFCKVSLLFLFKRPSNKIFTFRRSP